MNQIQYISGWEALNIPKTNGEIADWHPHLYPPIAKYRYNQILKSQGITERNIKNKTRFVASYARAIADLVYAGQTKELQNCVYDFLNDDETKELYKYLQEINKVKNIDTFIRRELTKFYFEDKTCENTSESE